MKCNNNFCIYCNNNCCILDTISLDELGLCEDCIYVNIDESIINAAKKKILEKYDSENSRG